MKNTTTSMERIISMEKKIKKNSVVEKSEGLQKTGEEKHGLVK
jgi:hypothetical protein